MVRSRPGRARAEASASPLPMHVMPDFHAVAILGRSNGILLEQIVEERLIVVAG